MKSITEKEFNPLISIIIPTYNRCDVVINTIQCVIQQTWKNIEILIIDDCSKDNTKTTLKSLQDKRVRLFSNNNNFGVCESRELGVNNSRGDFICFLDDDDYWELDHIEKMVCVFKKNDTDIAMSNYITNIKNNITKYNMYDFASDFRNQILRRQGPFLQCCMFRKEILFNKILFDNRSAPCEDWDFFINISNNNYLITHSQHYGFIWNFSKQSQSSNLILEAEALEYIINKHSDAITKKCGINVLSDHYRFIARVYEKIKRYDLATKKYNEAFLISKYYHKNIFYKIMLSINIKYNYRIINYLRVNKVK